MSSKLKLKIITPDNVAYESDEVTALVVPTTLGEITVLPGHIPLISRIKTGQMKIKKGEELLGLAISAGILEVRKDNTVVVLAERSELAHLIDIDRAKEAYERALSIKKRIKNDEDIDEARVNAMLEKELNRINIGTKWQSRRHF
jgi:F-type H+-transporting ATPase subunit epsilon